MRRPAPTWTSKVPDSGWLSPSIYDGKLFIASDNGRLYALDPQTGKQLWKVNVKDALRIQPFFNKGHAIICSRNKELIQIDLQRGKITHRMSLPDEPSASASIIGKYLALPIKNGGAILLDPRTWAPYCSIAAGYSTEVPLFEDGTGDMINGKFFFAGAKGKLIAFPLNLAR